MCHNSGINVTARNCPSSNVFRRNLSVSGTDKDLVPKQKDQVEEADDCKVSFTTRVAAKYPNVMRINELILVRFFILKKLNIILLVCLG